MRPQILLLDNADSFTSILAHELGVCGANVRILPVNEYKEDIPRRFDAMVISPGPGLPKDNQLPRIVRQNAGQIPLLGVCLGMQAIAEAYGGTLRNMEQVFHGQKRRLRHNEKGLFSGIPQSTRIGLYHSWCVDDPGSILNTDAFSEDNIIMALSHPQLSVCGVQFHPESYITEHGRTMLSNWMHQIMQ